MQLFVRGLQTHTFPNVANVPHLRELIEERLNVPAREQFLSIGGKPLRDLGTLEENGLREDCTVDLNVRCHGGEQHAHKVKSDCYYEVLGLTKGATEADITKAYRKLAMKYHPDRNQEKDAEENFKRVTEAYEVLKDKEKRTNYDRFGKESAHGNGPSGGAHPSGTTYSYEDANAIFQQFFRQFGAAGTDPFQRMGTTGSSRIFSFGGMDDDSMGLPSSVFGTTGGAHLFGHRSRQRPVQPSSATVAEGSVVAIKGLTHAPQHNGEIGVVVAYDEAESGRLVVRLWSESNVLALKPANLQPLAKGRIRALSSALHLNGQEAYVKGVASNGRFLVIVPSTGTEIAIKPTSFQLDHDTPVTLGGLQGSSQHNGKRAFIVEAASDGSRYTVQTSDGLLLRVKPDHVRPKL